MQVRTLNGRWGECIDAASLSRDWKGTTCKQDCKPHRDARSFARLSKALLSAKFQDHAGTLVLISSYSVYQIYNVCMLMSTVESLQRNSRHQCVKCEVNMWMTMTVLEEKSWNLKFNLSINFCSLYSLTLYLKLLLTTCNMSHVLHTSAVKQVFPDCLLMIKIFPLCPFAVWLFIRWINKDH